MSGNRIDEQLCDSREESAMTPKVQGETLVYRQDGQEQELIVDTAAWFAWLETASTFSFVSEEGLFTARPPRASSPAGCTTHTGSDGSAHARLGTRGLWENDPARAVVRRKRHTRRLALTRSGGQRAGALPLVSHCRPPDA